jgi:hypothetical protein
VIGKPHPPKQTSSTSSETEFKFKFKLSLIFFRISLSIISGGPAGGAAEFLVSFRFYFTLISRQPNNLNLNLTRTPSRNSRVSATS